jgi:hypothetical protein
MGSAWILAQCADYLHGVGGVGEERGRGEGEGGVRGGGG